MAEVARLMLPDATKQHLLMLMRQHLGHYRGLEAYANPENTSTKELADVDLEGLDARIAALILGLNVVTHARGRNPVRAPADWLEKEADVVTLCTPGASPPGGWYREVW